MDNEQVSMFLQMSLTSAGGSETLSSDSSAVRFGSVTASEEGPSSSNQQVVSDTTSWDLIPHASPSLMQKKSKYNEIAFDIEASKLHWSELSTFTRVDKSKKPHVSEEEASKQAKDLVIFENLKNRWGRFFKDGKDLTLGRKIAEGGQAEIYEVEGACLDGITIHGNNNYVVKVFKPEFSLSSLQFQWPQGMLHKSTKCSSGFYVTTHACPINGALMMKDNRFGFLMWKYWGDLRKLIEYRMQHGKSLGPPFNDEVGKRVMFDIAKGMAELHKDNIIHRDLKSSNVLVRWWREDPDYFDNSFYVAVADFECSVGVVGTRLWRAPEVLQALKEQAEGAVEVLFTQKADVYSYAMTCYEILTGRIPFEINDALVDVDAVLEGLRPELPDCVDPRVKALIESCWDPDPSKRPSFPEIVQEHWKIMWT